MVQFESRIKAAEKTHQLGAPIGDQSDILPTHHAILENFAWLSALLEALR